MSSDDLQELLSMVQGAIENPESWNVEGVLRECESFILDELEERENEL